MSEYTVYSKRNCSYCVRAIELLESKGLTHDVKKIDEDQNLFLELRQRAPSMRTMPVIFRNDQYTNYNVINHNTTNPIFCLFFS